MISFFYVSSCIVNVFFILLLLIISDLDSNNVLFSVDLRRELPTVLTFYDNNWGISFENIQKEIDVQRETLNKIFEDVFILKLRQMTIPLKGKKFRHRKKEDIRRTNLAQQLKDLVMFGIYVIILHAMVTNEKDHLVYQDYNIVTDLFRGKLTRTRDLYYSHHIADLYDYLNTTVIEAMHSTEWYDGYADEEPGMLLDRSNKYIGVARIRQHRVVPKECDTYFMSAICGPKYSKKTEEQRTFEDSWQQPREYLPVMKRTSSMWIYSYSSSTGSSSYLGSFSVYPGSGYVANMGRTRYNSLVNFNLIKEHHWIDRFTRVIFIEFLTYSANYNLFNSVRLVIERSPTGLMNSRVDIVPARMMYVGGELERRFLLYAIIFVVWLGVLFLNKTKLILRERLTYLKNFWSLLDLIIIIISLGTIILYMARIKSIGELLNTLEKVQHNQFVNYFNLFHVHLTLNIIGSILVSASTIRLWKLVRFFKVFRLFEKTILLVAKPVSALVLHHLVFSMACMMTMHLILGENSKDFESYWKTLKTLTQVYLNLYNGYVALLQSELNIPAIGMLVTYVFLSKIFFFIYIGIVVSCHLDAEEFFSQPQDELYSFVNYVKEELMFLFRWFKPKLSRKEQPVKKRVIYAKPAKYLYANSVSTTTHALISMTAVAATVLTTDIYGKRKDGTLSDKQIISMLRVCHFCLAQHTTDDRKEFFYKVLEARHLRVIDAKRIDKAKRVAEMVLGVTLKMEQEQRMNRLMILRNTMRDLEKADRRLDVCYRSLQNINIVENVEE